MPKNVVCKKCNNLVNDWCEKVIDSPDQDMQRDCQQFREKTNADRIRSMSDEELAAWIASMTTVCECCAEINECESPKCFNKCLHGVEDWLQQPQKLERNKSNRNMDVVEV